MLSHKNRGILCRGCIVLSDVMEAIVRSTTLASIMTMIMMIRMAGPQDLKYQRLRMREEMENLGGIKL